MPPPTALRIAWNTAALSGIGLAFLVWAKSTVPPTRSPPRTATGAEAAEPDPRRFACRAEQANIDAEIEAARSTCRQALDEFEACRASRAEWTSVELLSCSIDMTTSLAHGDVSEPATLNDCGNPASTPVPRGRPAECPVPACEAHLDALEAQVLARHGLTERPSC